MNSSATMRSTTAMVGHAALRVEQAIAAALRIRMLKTSVKTAIAVLLVVVASACIGAERSECAVGVYRDDGGDLLALTLATDDEARGLRYTFLNGDQGRVGVSGPGTVTCTAGAPSVAGRSEWRLVPLRSTPAIFTAPDGVRLKGLLLEPKNFRVKPPLVVLTHGSEMTSPILNYNQLLFAGQGISVFAYDKRGTAGSGGVYTQDFDRLAQDATAAVGEARRRASGRFGRLGIEGGSQGGWVAPAAALKANADFVEVAFGLVGTPVEQDQWQVDVELLERGFPATILPQVHEVTSATARIAESDFTAPLQDVDLLRRKYGEEPWFNRIAGQYSGLVLQGKLKQAKSESPHVPWKYRSAEILRRLAIPQLWILAADDSLAPSAITEQRLMTLKQQGNPIDIVSFPHTDHGIRLYTVDAEGQHHRGRMADGYLRLLGDWAKGSVHYPYGDAAEIRGPR